MSNTIKLNDNAEIHLPFGGTRLFRIFMNNYQVSLISTNPSIDVSESTEFFMASVTSNGADDLSSWNIDISREAAIALQVDGVTFTEEAKEALSHE